MKHLMVVGERCTGTNGWFRCLCSLNARMTHFHLNCIVGNADSIHVSKMEIQSSSRWCKKIADLHHMRGQDGHREWISDSAGRRENS